MNIKREADATIFTIRDQGDRSVGVEPIEISLTISWEVEREQFESYIEKLDLLTSEEDWHGHKTVYVQYKCELGDESFTELVEQIEWYQSKSQVMVSII